MRPRSVPNFSKAKAATTALNVCSCGAKRFLIAEELTEGRAINVTALKQIQDVGEITARLIARNNMSFQTTHSLFVTTNYIPIVSETDHGAWRRLALLRFPYTFRKPGEELEGPKDRPGDPGLKLRIKAGASGQHDAIVTWAVDGRCAGTPIQTTRSL